MRFLSPLFWSLFLTLAACAKVTEKSGGLPVKYASAGRVGYTNCRGTLGNFDVFTMETDTPDLFDVAVLPTTAPNTTSTIQAYVLNSDHEYKLLEIAVALNTVGSGRVVGQMTMEEIKRIDLLALSPTDNTGTPFLDQSPSVEAICQLPIPE